MLLFGHRGYSDQYSENTMLAFSKAIESGFDGIETDVHKTKDGVLVLCHDEKINRTSDGKGYIKDMTYEELCAYNFGTKENPQRISLLKELLELCKGKNVKINLEIKTNKNSISRNRTRKLSNDQRNGDVRSSSLFKFFMLILFIN